MSNNDGTKILLAFLAGAAVGAAVGYFLNSDKKDELYADLKESAEHIKEGIKENLGKAKDIFNKGKHSEPVAESAPEA